MTDQITAERIEYLRNHPGRVCDLDIALMTAELLASRHQEPVEPAETDKASFGVDEAEAQVHEMLFGEMPDYPMEFQFHLDRMNAWFRELWTVKDIDLHMSDGTIRRGQSGLLSNIRDDVRALRRAASIPKPGVRASTIFQAIRGHLDSAASHADVMSAIESALEPSTSEGEAAYWENIHTGDVRKTKPLSNVDAYRPLYAAPQPTSEEECKACDGTGSDLLAHEAALHPCKACGGTGKTPPPTPVAPVPVTITKRKGIYVASKVKYAEMWKDLRHFENEPIISTWIDEAGVGESASLEDLWRRCVHEASTAGALIIYRRPNEVLKGAWVELGAALASGVPVFAVGIEEFTVANHAGIKHCADLIEARRLARAALSAKPTGEE